MNKTYSFSEWVRISIDEDGLDRSELEEIDSRLSSTFNVCVRGLKGISELFQLLGYSAKDGLDVDSGSLASLGFLIEELTETINMCQELKEINLKRQFEYQYTGEK